MIRTIFKLLNYREKRLFFFIFFLLIINSILELFSIAIFFPIFQLLFDDKLPNNFYYDIINNSYFNFQSNSSEFYILSLLICVCFIFLLKSLFYIYFNYEQNNFIKLIRERISYELVHKYIFLSYHFFFKKTLQNIIKNINLSINFPVVVQSLIIFFSEIVIVSVLIFFLLKVQFKITLIIFLSLTLIAILFKIFIKDRFYKLGLISQKYSEILNKEIIQTFSGIKEIKILKKEMYFLNKFSKINKLEAKNNFIRDIFLQLPKVFIELFAVLFLCVTVYFMFYFKYSRSDILIYLSFIVLVFIRLMPSAIRIFSSLQRFNYHQPLNQIVINEFKIKDDKKFLNIETKKYIDFKKSIKFNNVNFFYSKKEIILKNVNFEIKKNSCVGIVGASGSGKSTIADLLMGLISPTFGSISVDRIPILGNLDLWQDKISYVSQFPYFLNDTIEKNIAFGVNSKNINKKLLIESSKKARIYDEIKNKLYRFKSVIGENGVALSGGQLQRIAIARALYKKSEVLILDEATSSLDSTNEKFFFEFIKHLKGLLTIIIISHKKNNLSFCDKIYKVEKSKVFKFN